MSTWIVNWFTKANILIKNHRKITYYSPKPIPIIIFNFIGGYLLIFILSWVEVLFKLYYIFKLILDTIRYFINPLPEFLKNLYFPLKNNPNLECEEVWAHVIAIAIAGGVRVRVDGYLGCINDIQGAINDILKIYPAFNVYSALLQLQSLIHNTPRDIEVSRVINDYIASYDYQITTGMKEEK